MGWWWWWWWWWWGWGDQPAMPDDDMQPARPPCRGRARAPASHAPARRRCAGWRGSGPSCASSSAGRPSRPPRPPPILRTSRRHRFRSSRPSPSSCLARPIDPKPGGPGGPRGSRAGGGAARPGSRPPPDAPHTQRAGQPPQPTPRAGPALSLCRGALCASPTDIPRHYGPQPQPPPGQDGAAQPAGPAAAGPAVIPLRLGRAGRSLPGAMGSGLSIIRARWRCGGGDRAKFAKTVPDSGSRFNEIDFARAFRLLPDMMGNE